MSDEEVKEAALNEKLKPINDDQIIDNPKDNNNIIIDNDNLIKEDNNIISTNTKEDIIIDNKDNIINTNSKPKTIDLNKAKILSIAGDYIEVDYKGQKYTLNLRAIPEEKQVVVKIKAVTMKINELRVKCYDESNLVELRKINAEINKLVEKFSNYWDYFDIIKGQAETSLGGHMSNLEFVGSKISNNVIDLNNYVKVMDDKGNTLINYGQSKTFKISNGPQSIDVKITSEYGMPMDKQPTNWEQIRGGLKKFNEAYQNLRLFGEGGELEAYIIDENAISSIELDVPVKDNNYYRFWCSGDANNYDINVKIHLNDGTTLIDTYKYGIEYQGYTSYWTKIIGLSNK
jgi:hypothetical protein